MEEIRVRTLKNLLNKVELKLLFEEDLIQEQTLLIRLLEWFNFPSCPMKQEVLSFLRSLSKVINNLKVREQIYVFMSLYFTVDWLFLELQYFSIFCHVLNNLLQYSHYRP